MPLLQAVRRRGGAYRRAVRAEPQRPDGRQCFPFHAAGRPCRGAARPRRQPWRNGCPGWSPVRQPGREPRPALSQPVTAGPRGSTTPALGSLPEAARTAWPGAVVAPPRLRLQAAHQHPVLAGGRASRLPNPGRLVCECHTVRAGPVRPALPSGARRPGLMPRRSGLPQGAGHSRRASAGSSEAARRAGTAAAARLTAASRAATPA